MAITSEDKILIKQLRIEKNYSVRKFLSEFPSKGWSMRTLNRLIKKIDETGNTDRKLGSGRKRSVRSANTINAVQELVLSQDDKPGQHLSVRQISKQIQVSKTTVNRIIARDLNLICFKKKKAQELSVANKLTRLTRSKQLLRKYPAHTVPFIWFTDEKVFTVAAPSNPQRDRVYAKAGIRKKQISAERLLTTRPTFSQSVMVSVGVSMLGCTNLIFVEPGVKINGDYYRNVLLREHLLPAIRETAGEFFVFQQDNAPAHRAHATVEMLRAETPDFISPYLWPPNSPDLNPVDFKIWGVLDERVYSKGKLRDVNHLRERLVQEWAKMDQIIVDRAIEQWRGRLQACVNADGGHFEYKLSV